MRATASGRLAPSREALAPPPPATHERGAVLNYSPTSEGTKGRQVNEPALRTVPRGVA